MRNALLVSAAWLGVLQGALATNRLQAVVYILTIATMSIALGLRAYKLGAWSKGVDDAVAALGARLDAVRCEIGAWFTQVDRRLDGIDHMATLVTEQCLRLERRQARAERRLDRVETQQNAERLQ